MNTTHSSLAIARLLLVSIALLILGNSSLRAQGNLTPPGAPAPAMKSLDQIASTGIAINAANTPPAGSYQFVISAPGNYYLSQSLNVTNPNNSCIHITTQGVTVDLNGFQISGASSAGPGNGIYIEPVATNSTIKNGSVAGFGTGIECLARGGVCSHITVSACSTGLELGPAGKAEFCDAHDNSTGIYTEGDGCLITHCVAGYNQSAGIDVEATIGCSVRDCSVSHSGNGIVFGTGGCSAINCDASFNSGDGIFMGSGGSTINCTLTANGDNGISAGGRCTIYGCNCASQTNHGIQMGDDCTVSQCTASFNLAGGISGSSRNTISGCTASENTGDGIFCVRDCLIVGNNCSGNTGNGIRVNGQINRIDGNLANENGKYGIFWVNDLVIRNTAFVNATNYFPPVGVGNTGPINAASTSTNAWANF